MDNQDQIWVRNTSRESIPVQIKNGDIIEDAIINPGKVKLASGATLVTEHPNLVILQPQKLEEEQIEVADDSVTKEAEQATEQAPQLSKSNKQNDETNSSSKKK